MSNQPKPEQTRYIGDGVYATFDGCGIEIRINDHRSPVVVYLEPDVLRDIVLFLDSHQRAD